MHVIARHSIGGCWRRKNVRSCSSSYIASCGAHISETRHIKLKVAKKKRNSYFLVVCELLTAISIHPQDLPAHLHISPKELDRPLCGKVLGKRTKEDRDEL